MAITYISKRYGGARKNIDGSISADEYYLFLFTEAESSVDILAETEIPEIGDSHTSDSTLKVSHIACSEPFEGDHKKGNYIVTVTYDRQVDTTSNIPNRNIAPWRQPPFNISIQSNEYVVPFTKAFQAGDSNGSPSKPVINPVGDPYEDSTTFYTQIIKGSYNVQSFNDSWINSYIETVNSSSIRAFGILVPAKKGRLKELQATYHTQNDNEGNIQYRYWQLDIAIEVSSKLWQKELMILGLFFLSGGEKYRIYTDNDGNFGKKADMGTNAVAVDEAQKLTSSGALYTGSTAEYETFQEKYAASWSALKIPTKATI